MDDVVQQRTVGMRVMVGLLAVITLVPFGFLIVDSIRMFFEWRGHHELFMPGDPRRGLFDKVMIADADLFMLMIRFRGLLLIVSTLIVLPLILRSRSRRAVGLPAAVCYFVVVASICLLLFHYHLGLWR
jgi:hypothetical protein